LLLFFFFFFNDTATTEIYTLSLHDALPISWLLVPAEWADAGKEKAFVDFLTWMVDKGQTMTSALEYAPLPKNVAAKVKARIKEVKVKTNQSAKK